MAKDNAGILIRIPFIRLFDVLRVKKKEIAAIYFFALMFGLLQLSIPIGVQAIINFIQAYTFSTSLWILIFLVVLGVGISGSLQVTQMKIIERINQKIFCRFSFEYAYQIPRLDMKSVDDYYLPELVNRFFDTVTLQKGLSKIFLDIPVASIQIIFGLILLSLYNPVFIIFGLLLLFAMILVMYLTSNRGFRTSIQESDYKYGVASWLEEMARSLKTFKFSKGTAMHIAKSDTLVKNYLGARTDHFRVLLIQYWTLILFKVLITAAMLIVGAFLAINNIINLGQFVAAEIVIIMIMSSVEKFIFSLDNVYDTLTSVEKLSKLLDKPEEKSGSLPFIVSDNGPDIQVEELSFCFDDDEEVLKQISFNIPAGSKVCICGEEGAGKSILLRLLSGSYSDFTGEINIAGVPINNYNLKELRRNTGIILYEQEIFDGSVIENITMGSEDIPFSQVRELAAALGFQSAFSSLPKGYETKLTATGRRLSRSIVQKILLMRALVHQPQLLLLEEPWSALSATSQQLLHDYLLQHSHATMLVATNNIDFARKCDLVIELKEGRLFKAGSPETVFGI